MRYKKEKMLKRNSELVVSKNREISTRLLIACPLTGLVRAEWMMGRYSQAIPCNWSQVELVSWLDTYSPMGFQVADARNVATHKFIEGGFEWLFFIDHDVVMPPNTFSAWNQRMHSMKDPVWGGLYFTKSVPSEPLVYRELGHSYYAGWKLGDEVRVRALGNGCTVYHRSVMKEAWDIAEEYKVGDSKVRMVWQTPTKQEYDAETETWLTTGGTEDIHFQNYLITKGLLKKAGWPRHQKMKYPYLVDTKVFCRHIDNNGVQYPSMGEEQEFIREVKKK